MNYTGPIPKDLPASPCHASPDAAAIQEAGVRGLEADSEDAYKLTQLPAYCLVAMTILVDCRECYGSARSAAWWGARALRAQQQQLQGNASSIFERADELWRSTLRSVEGAETKGWNEGSIGVEVRQRLRLEMALWYHEFDMTTCVKEQLDAAQEVSGSERPHLISPPLNPLWLRGD